MIIDVVYFLPFCIQFTLYFLFSSILTNDETRTATKRNQVEHGTVSKW